MAPKKSSPSSHASRAAAILASARKAAQSPTKPKPKPTSTSASASTSASTSTSTSDLVQDESLDSPISLQQLMSHISTATQLPMRDSMAMAAKLIKSRLNTVNKLTKLSPMSLDDAGIESNSENGKKVLAAFRGRKAAGLKSSPKKSSTFKDPFDIPSTSTSSRSNLRSDEPELDYVFNETLTEDSLVGKFVLVNRSPVMCAWAMVVLERLGFKRSEALSLAQCYVSQASHSRGVSIGVISKDQDLKRKRESIVGNNQPHFQLMGMKLPLMRLNVNKEDVSSGNVVGDGENDDGGEWRGIESGVVVGPERAFNYMKKSLAQTLPLLIGALSLLADSYINPPSPDTDSKEDIKKEETNQNEEGDSKPNVDVDISSTSTSNSSDPNYGPDHLNDIAYSLYCDFRPETGGQWGKKSRLEMNKILSLRRGRESERTDGEGDGQLGNVKRENQDEGGGGEGEGEGEDNFDFEGEDEALEMEREAERLLEEEREEEIGERETKRIKKEE